VTTADLAWHVSSSVNRLLAQAWPCLIWLLFSMLRTPEEYFRTPELAPAGVSAAKKRRQGATSKANA
jgi:hypothetical protein